MMKDTLDLHGISHLDAKNIAGQFIDEHVVNSTFEFYIITGHSEPMKNIVKDICKEYNLTATESFTNAGQLKIT